MTHVPPTQLIDLFRNVAVVALRNGDSASGLQHALASAIDQVTAERAAEARRRAAAAEHDRRAL
jgi:uncharacterized membrane protein YgcG